MGAGILPAPRGSLPTQVTNSLDLPPWHSSCGLRVPVSHSWTAAFDRDRKGWSRPHPVCAPIGDPLEQALSSLGDTQGTVTASTPIDLDQSPIAKHGQEEDRSRNSWL